MLRFFRRSNNHAPQIAALLQRHFGLVKPDQLNIAERQFPFRVRAAIRNALSSR
jgi:hypothetical protein